MTIEFRTAAPALAIFLCLAGCATAPLPHRDRASQLRQQADAWDLAIVRKDLPSIARNMAQSFQQIDSQGHLSNKSEFLSGITSEKLVIFPYRPENVVIRLYGDVALITGTTDLHGTYGGKSFRTHYRYTDTYVKESGNWRVVNVQTTEMSD